jgi:NC domain.
MAKGDHLVVNYGLYLHHALDIGDGLVIQYGRRVFDKAHAIVEIVSRETFSRGIPIMVVDRPANYSPDEIVRRAFSRLGEQDYSLFTNNCEHFVNWCCTGQSESRQIDRLVKLTSSVATKMAIKVGVESISKVAIKSSTKIPGKTVIRTTTPWLLVADAAQFVTEVAASSANCDQATAEQAGKVVGLGASVGIGAAVGGPVGAIAGFALWLVGEVVGNDT